jgi:acyl-CoA thioesterase I
MLLAGILATCFFALLAPLLYVGWSLDRAPSHTPADILATGRPEGRVLLCLGDSITHGRIGADWVGAVRDRYRPHGLTVVNGGNNGELVWNVRQRLNEALSLRPNLTILMIGSNDVMGADHPDRAKGYKRGNKLPQSPDLLWSIEQLRQIVGELKQGGGEVALCTIPPLGDDPTASGELTAREYNAEARSIAEDAGLRLIDVHALLTAVESSASRPYAGGIWPVVSAVVRAAGAHYLLGRSWDAIGERGGWSVTVDGIHLTDRAGAIITDAASAWIDGTRSQN